MRYLLTANKVELMIISAKVFPRKTLILRIGAVLHDVDRHVETFNVGVVQADDSHST